MNRRLEELRRGIENLVTFLGLPSGATLHQLRQAAYYAAMTYHRHEFDALPYLALRGVKGVGRSALLKALGLFCYDAVAIDIASETPATLKEKLVQTESGTVLLDGHGDSKTRDVVEAYLKGRYTRPSAEASGMGPASEGQLTERQSLTLGATVVHLADRFEDQGLGLRGVWLTLQMNESRHGNDYQDIPESLVSIGRESLSSTMGFEFPRMPAPKGIPGRIAARPTDHQGLAALDPKPLRRRLIVLLVRQQAVAERCRAALVGHVVNVPVVVHYPGVERL